MKLLKAFVCMINLVFLFLLNANSQSTMPSGKRIAPQQAYSRLMKIKLFALGGISADGHLSDGEIYFTIILKSKSAIPYFKEIAKNGSYAAKLYALCGLRKTDMGLFQDFLELLKERSAYVDTMSGCSQGFEDFSELVSQIAIGFYDGFLSDIWAEAHQ